MKMDDLGGVPAVQETPIYNQVNFIVVFLMVYGFIQVLVVIVDSKIQICYMWSQLIAIIVQITMIGITSDLFSFDLFDAVGTIASWSQ